MMTIEPFTYDPYTPRVIGHNVGPALDDESVAPTEPHIAAFKVIDDLFDEARNFADGEPIDSDELHDAISDLREQLHEAGKVAEALRVAAKKPLDDQIAKIQSLYNPYVQPKKGKVDMGKASLDALTTAWRVAKAAAARKEADRIAAIAAAEQAKAQEALRASAGNLTARVEAEEQVETSKAWAKAASRAEKAATTGLGLRTVWRGDILDWDAVLDWAYARDQQRFRDLCQQMVDEAVRANVRTIPGVNVIEDKRAA